MSNMKTTELNSEVTIDIPTNFDILSYYSSLLLRKLAIFCSKKIVRILAILILFYMIIHSHLINLNTVISLHIAFLIIFKRKNSIIITISPSLKSFPLKRSIGMNPNLKFTKRTLINSFINDLETLEKGKYHLGTHSAVLRSIIRHFEKKKEQRKLLFSFLDDNSGIKNKHFKWTLNNKDFKAEILIKTKGKGFVNEKGIISSKEKTFEKKFDKYDIILNIY